MHNTTDPECLHCRNRFTPSSEDDFICPACCIQMDRWRNANRRAERTYLILWALVLALILWWMLS